ncbi:MAG: cation diffusion facilitator family transporter [Dehalococcoidia bacterium]|nr:cation diffusion facilitator family transporter [Dehalococcoidia bacterium]
MVERKMGIFTTKRGAVILALGVVTGLIVLKAVVAAFTRSISITAQATDSFLDLFAIGIAFLAVRISGEPADEEHPFGHSKIEPVATGIQATLILTAAFFIIYSAIRRIIDRTPLELTEAGIGVMLVSTVASIFLSRHLRRVAKASESTVLDALAKNINADIYSAAGVLIGLLFVRITNVQVLDPIIALVMAGVILKSAYDVIRRSFVELTDTRLPPDEHRALLTIINEHFHHFAGFHEVRSRRAGGQRFIDLHLVMPRNVSVEEAHVLCDHLEQDIKNRLPNASVVIHVEPCDDTRECLKCQVAECAIRQAKD